MKMPNARAVKIKPGASYPPAILKQWTPMAALNKSEEAPVHPAAEEAAVPAVINGEVF
jgi:hypothetical protein